MKIKKKHKKAITHFSKRKVKSMAAHTNARNPYQPPWVTLTGLLTPFGEADVKTSIGHPNPVLMFPNRDAFQADVAMLDTPRGKAVEHLGWIDRAGFDEFIRKHHVDPGGVITMGVGDLRPVKELFL